MTTPHGVVETPAFMPVGTQGAVKGVHASRPRSGRRADPPQQHLSPVPAPRRRPDCAARRTPPVYRLDEADPHRQRRLSGLQPRRAPDDRRGRRRFQSHLDGSPHLLTPEKAADIQAQLGSDIAMVLDECLALPGDAGRGSTSMERTLRWARARRERMLQLRAGAVDGVSVTNRRPGAVRHRAGRRFPDFATRAPRETVGDRVRGVCDRRAQRRRTDRRHVPARRAHGAAAAGRSAAVSDGRRHAGGSRGMRSRGASTCSTACCRRGTRATASSSPAKDGSTSRTRGTPRTTARSIPHASATPAGRTRAPICGICSWPVKSTRPPLTRCII